MIRAAFLSLVPPLALAACTTGADEYPSLAIRDVERPGGQGTPVAPEAAVPEVPPLSANVGTRIGQLVDQARQAHGTFEARLAPAGRAVSAARGSGVASERWVDAQVALSGLEAARSGAMVAMAELDVLYAQERLARTDIITPDAAALGEARDRVGAWTQAEDRAIARLLDQLGTR